MRSYLKNLMTAICGANPYRLELDKLKEDMEKAGANVRVLQDAYYSVQEKRDDLEKLLEDYAKQMNSLQTLVENYRERLKEKDAMIEDIRKDYQRQMDNYVKRVGDYSMTIAELQKKLDEMTGNVEAKGSDI